MPKILQSKDAEERGVYLGSGSLKLLPADSGMSF
jgi:hypothetical protein